MRELHAEFVDSVDDIPRYKRINLEWHLAVARASGSELLIALMEAISQPIMDAAGYQQVTTDEVRNEAIRAHGRIMEAIAAQNPKAAFTRMERHVSAYSELARRAMSSDQ
jgi:DNA-binding FadR family transcriptional regulator